MKDLPHHLKKLYRNVVRSAKREEKEEEEYTFQAEVREQTARELRKQQKRRNLKERLERTPAPLTLEEKNKKMRNRVPVFDRINNAKPKGAKKSSKKTPRI